MATPVRALANVMGVCCAVLIAYLSSGLTGLCGGSADCGPTSQPAVISYLAWAGFGGVLAAAGLRLVKSSRFDKLVFAVTAGAYLGWLCLFVVYTI